jgi:molybdenum cofactor cytidylyltransferase
MGCSLACAVNATADADGWVVALADMPWIAPATIAAVADALADGADLAATSFGGRRAHPVGFAKRHRPALSALTGDDGAKSVVAAHLSQLRLIEVDDDGVVRDVDTVADLPRA